MPKSSGKSYHSVVKSTRYRFSWSSLNTLINRTKSLFGCLCESLKPLQSHALLILEINKVQHFKWCMKQSSLQKSSDQHTAQLAEHQSDDLEVVGSNPTGGHFLMKFILFWVTLDLSDNLTEMRIVNNPIIAILCVCEKLGSRRTCAFRSGVFRSLTCLHR